MIGPRLPMHLLWKFEKTDEEKTHINPPEISQLYFTFGFSTCDYALFIHLIKAGMFYESFQQG